MTRAAAPSRPPVSGMLRKVRSAAELENSLKSSLPEVIARRRFRSGPVTTASGGSGDFSSTYTAEAGVDEFDYARYDGTHLYVAPTPWSDTQVARAIRILRTDPASGTATQVSSIPIEGDQQVQGLYVADGRLVMLTSEAQLHALRRRLDRARSCGNPPSSRFTCSTSTIRRTPRRILHAELDGVFVATRRVGDRVYLVSRHTPSVPLDPPGRSQPRGHVAHRSAAEGHASAGRTQPLVAPSDCYITNGADHPGLSDSDHHHFVLDAESGRLRQHLLQRGSQRRLRVDLGALRVAAAHTAPRPTHPRASTSSRSPTRRRPTRARWKSRACCGWAASTTSA